MREDDASLAEQERLEIHRRTLALLLKQAALHGGEAFAPPSVFHGIYEAREQIRELKAALRGRGTAVDDLAGDEPPAPEPPAAPRARDDGGVTITISGGQVGQVIGKQINTYYLPRPELPPDRNRQAMLQRVRTTWISGLLERSLDPAARIPLGFTELPGAVELPLNDDVQELAGAARARPPGTNIFDLFVAYGGALLMLGAPGAGKTTLLLELARELLARAEQDRYHPIPVVFNLSSWARRRQPIADWMLEELQTKYDVPRNIAKGWVASDALLPLLDGLDEVAPEQRAECVAAINQFRRAHGLVPLAVCSRHDDYQRLPSRLRLQGAVLVQPLTPGQIDEFLERGGQRLAGLRSTLRHDAALYELAQAPLMLAVLALAYENERVEAAPPEQSPATRRRLLFDRYVERMFTRRARETRYTPAQAVRWLGWLAWQMQQRGQTIFYLEALQPDWLPARQARWYRLIVPLCIGLFVGLSVGAAAEMMLGVLWGTGAALGAMLGADLAANGLDTWPARRRRLWAALVGLSAGLASSAFLLQVGTRSAGLSRVLLLIALSAPLFALPTSALVFVAIKPLHRLAARAARYTSQQLAIGLFVGLGIGLSAGISAGLVALLISPGRWQTLLRLMLYIGVGLGFGGGLLASHGGMIQVADRLRWSWRAGGLAGALAAVAVGALFNWDQGVRAGITFGLLAGLTSAELKADTRLRPNQGIWRSAGNALTGLLVGSAASIVMWLALFRPAASSQRIVATIVFVCLLWSFRGGLAACVEHAALRLLLLRQGTTPRQYIRFLNDAAGRTFLRNVGAGYIFLHRTLQEYFADRAQADQPHSEGMRPQASGVPVQLGRQEPGMLPQRREDSKA